MPFFNRTSPRPSAQAIATAVIATWLLACGPLAPAQAGVLDGAPSCDPTRASCVGSTGGGSTSDCTPSRQALGLCQPSDGGGGGGSCSANPNGNPSCGGDGPATQGDTGPTTGGGNPINLVTGNKYQQETDLPALPGVLGLELKRHYNSLSSHPGLIGAHWRMSYETVLYDYGSQLQIVQADGRRLMFQRGTNGHAALCTSAQPQDGQVRIEEAKDTGQRTYHWRWPDGRTLTFTGGNGGGYPLHAIAAPTGEQLTLSYSPQGDLVQVRDPQGRKLTFIYAAADKRRSRALQAIDTPLGRVNYRQDSQGRLTEAAYSPDAHSAPTRTRIYHYEDRYNGGHSQALTGISVRGLDPAGRTLTQRLSTYAYNAAGQAILSTKGRPKDKDGQPADSGIEQIQLEYLAKALPFEGQAGKNGEVQPRQLGKTLVTNSLGQRSTVLSAVIGGRYRLIEFTGPGCSTCTPANMRYAYNSRGQLLQATRLDEHGQPVASQLTQYDPYGRAARSGRQAYDHGRAQPVQWTRRYEYEDVKYPDGSVALAPQPSLIAQPSVAPGQEHTLRIAYDALGQPTHITEEGYSPLDEQGQPSAHGTPISRTTNYRYAKVGSRTVLVEIDGPLPNGPKGDPSDSDVTRLQYDTAGQLVGIVYPMGLQAHIETDSLTGHIERISGPSGVTDIYRYDTEGAVASITQMRGKIVVGGRAYRHDDLGRLIETLAVPGGAEAPATLQAYDVAGRLLWQADALGILRRAVYDTEDHLLASQVTGAGIQQEERYTYGPSGRLEAVSDSTGATRELVRDAAGHIAATVDPLGRWTRYTSSAGQWQEVRGSNTPQPLTVRYGANVHGEVDAVSARNGKRTVTTRLLKDDFGREVGVLNPDRGMLVKRYDAADRLIRLQDATGTLVDIVHDLAGRVLRRTTTPQASAGAQAGGIPSKAATPLTDSYVYDGTRLVEMRNAEQSERYGYDAAGRLSVRTVRLLLGQRDVTSVTRYRYDSRGQLIAQTMPDGSELRYERNGQGQITSLSRQTASWLPLGWGRQVLVNDLERDLMGLRHMTFGNGVRGQWQRSKEGVLARVVYTGERPSGNPLRTALERLLPQAHAAVTPSASPGAFGLPINAQALWDSRLLFDQAGNLVAQAQFAANGAVQPSQSTYAYDAHNQLAQAIRSSTSAPLVSVVASNPLVWRYHHDSLGNRLLAQQPAQDVAHLAYAANSDRAAGMALDAAGRPLHLGEHDLSWNAQGRLTTVAQAGRVLAEYRYNEQGERVTKQVKGRSTHYLYDLERHRIADLDDQGRVVREYVWLANQLVALIDLAQPVQPPQSVKGVWPLMANTLHAAWRRLTGDGDAVAFVQVNHLGAPIAMTDVHGRPVWSADYAPFGRRLDAAQRSSAKVGAYQHTFKLDLRLPGQWEDQETGLYYNDQRYYDPNTGRYLSPDPIGLKGGLNAYAYVGNNPLAFDDPFGLVLFAFDGTGNTNDSAWNDSHDSSASNVWQFDQLYTDGGRDYITGVGTVYKDAKYGDIDPANYARGTRLGLIPGISLESADMGGNYSGPIRIQRMIQYFNDESDLATEDDTAMEVDTVGFSRGAAEARDFANYVVAHTTNGYYRYTSTQDGQQHCQKVDFRFMGLFDTVLSTNYSGTSYNLAIPDQFQYVAQAVALNEYRGDTHHAGLSSWGAFPLESIMNSANASATSDGKTRIESGFIGAHADIGGGFGVDESQLSKVALAWMVQQAKDAGVEMLEPPSTLISNPIVHDKSDSILYGKPGSHTEDRQVHYQGGSSTTQRQMTFQSGMSYTDTTQFINYFGPDDPRRRDGNFQTGTVDMQRYIDWLKENGYGINMTVGP